MKKTLTFLAVLSFSIAAHSTILRVNNTKGIDAPYKTFLDAHAAAEAGDTIMLDGSDQHYGDSYGRFTIEKPITVIGPGYWLVPNGIVSEGANTASFSAIDVKAKNVTLQGITVNTLNIRDSLTVVTRCKLGQVYFYNSDANKCVISQCFVTRDIETYGGTTAYTSGHLITNNIFSPEGLGTVSNIERLNQSIIAYNTCRGELRWNSCIHSTIERNINLANETSKTCSVVDNYGIGLSEVLTSSSVDKEYVACEALMDIQNSYGAFAGDHPYVLGGVPSGPVIADVEMPTSVEKGSKVSVTIQVSISR